jgi:transaldolase
MSRLHDLQNHGQAVWFDFIRRSFVASGELQSLIDAGVRGVTSNPTIFEKAIAGSNDYDSDIQTLVTQGSSVGDIYETLALADIAAGADLFRPLYNQSQGGDGYISIEVSPTLAHDTAGTITEAKRLFATLNRPNVMIKIPATPAGMPAITEVIGSGINVNVTLIFSLAQYEAVVEAYLAGLEQLAAAGGNLHNVASVASFFVSRVDTAADKQLDALGRGDLAGKTAIANAKIAYARFKELFQGNRWDALAANGANMQRPLWASTGTKDPRFGDTLYVDTLIGPHTVNTVPPATLDAFRDHGTVAATVETGLEAAYAHLAEIAALGVNLAAITQQLQDEGVASFAKSFESLMASISTKREAMLVGTK